MWSMGYVYIKYSMSSILVKLDEIGISVYVYIQDKKNKHHAEEEFRARKCCKEESRTTSYPYPSLGRPNIQSQKEEEEKKSKPNSMCHVHHPRNACPPKKKKARAAFFRFRSRNQTMGSSDATRKDAKQTPKSTLVQTISCTLRTPTSPSSPHPRHPPLHGRSRPHSRDSSS